MKKRMIAIAALMCAAILALGCACGTKGQQPAAEPAASAAKETPAEVPVAQPEDSAKPTETAGSATETKPAYKLGDKVEDFEVLLCDGTRVTLYGLLAEKKAVLVNFWATYCNPCRIEFPCMQEAYEQMADEIGILALSGWSFDTDETVRAFKEELELDSLSMGCAPELAKRFGTSGFPTSVMIDRNGILCLIELGSIPDTAKFLRLFKTFTADDYSAPVLLDEIPLMLPDVEPASAEAMIKALNIKDDSITVSASDDQYMWPFVPDGDCVKASNGETPDSVAQLVVNVTLAEGEALAYEYAAELLPMMDILAVELDGVPVNVHCETAARTMDYVGCDKAGEHTVTFTLTHPMYSSDTIGVTLANLRVLSADERQRLDAAKQPFPAKTLMGTECEITLKKGSAKQAEFVTATSGTSGDSISVGILSDDSATLHIKLGEDVDDRFAFYAFNGTDGLISSLARDDDGYIIEYDGSGETDESASPINILYVYSSILKPNSDALAEYFWCGSEEAMDRYVAFAISRMQSLGMESTASWSYSDGSPRLTEPSQTGSEPSQTGTDAPAAEIGKYKITVTDEAGHPIEGVMLQICDVGTCQVVQTDGSGLAEFSLAPYPYEIHVLVVPEGYESMPTAFTMPEKGGELAIKLKKLG